MGQISTTQSFSTGDQVTAATLNGIMSNSALTSDVIEGSTLSFNSSNKKLSVGTVVEANIGNNQVTVGKLGQLADGQVLGNVSGGTANVAAVPTATVSAAGFTPTSYGTEESIKLPNGLIIKQGRQLTSGTDQTVTFSTASGETAFSTVISAIVTAEKSGALVTSCSLDTLTTTTLKAQFTSGTTAINYFVIGK